MDDLSELQVHDDLVIPPGSMRISPAPTSPFNYIVTERNCSCILEWYFDCGSVGAPVAYQTKV